MSGYGVDALPVWLLDVDGVINAAHPGWGSSPRRVNVVAMGEVWPMRWAPALVARIWSLHASGAVEIRWCSTWCPYAERVEAAFSLPEFGRALTDAHVPGGTAGDALKLAAARAVVRAGRRLVWTDDTAVPISGPVREEFDAAGALLIRPASKRGLQPEDLAAIEEFVKTS